MKRYWLRRDATRLAVRAMQSGLLPSYAQEAIDIGARMLAHGFTGHELDQMIQRAYAERLKGTTE